MDINQVITYADVSRCQHIWKTSVQPKWKNLLDAQFKAGESIRPKPKPLFHVVHEITKHEFWFWWNAGSLDFEFFNGSPVGRDELRVLIDTFGTGIKDSMALDTQALLEGTLDLQTWTVRMKQNIKDVNIIAHTLANGGWDQMTPQSWGYTGATIKAQYAYLNRWVDQIASGDPAGLQGAISRATSYVDTAYGVYSNEQRRLTLESGAFNEEMRVSEPGACDECAPSSGFWAPLGSLPPIGTLKCRNNCRCHFEYRYTPEVNVW